MWVRVHADGSWDREAKIGGWGTCVISPDGEAVWASGLCLEDIGNSVHAELQALVEGARVAMERWGDKVEGVILHSDCEKALFLASNWKSLSLKDPVIASLQRKFGELTGTFRKIKVKYSWVRGHQSRSDREDHKINCECDRLADEARLWGTQKLKAMRHKELVEEFIQPAPIGRRVLMGDSFKSEGAQMFMTVEEIERCLKGETITIKKDNAVWKARRQGDRIVFYTNDEQPISVYGTVQKTGS